MENHKENKAFAKGVPTAFIVQSAFQLLCAVEAIREFSIDNFKIVFCLYPGFPLRNEQMRRMAKQMSFQYVEYDVTEIREDDFYNKIGLFASKADKLYKRVFIGDYHNLLLLMMAYKYSDEESILLYLDDGNSSLSIFKGVRRDNRPSEWRKQLNWYKNVYKQQKRARNILETELSKRGLLCTSCFFTLYSDVKTCHYFLYPNTFHNLASQYTTNKISNKIYIIGCAVDAYVDQYRISTSAFEAILWYKLCELRELYPNQPIIFIPHGRDQNTNIPVFCEMLDVTYQRLDETIEYFMLKKEEIPQAIYGINSTALFTTKRMFPKAIVTNWLVDKRNDNSYYKFYKSVNRYFSQNGIETEVIKYPGSTILEQVKTLADNLYGILKLTMKKLHFHYCPLKMDDKY